MTTTDASLDAIMEVMAAAFDPAFGEAWTRRQVADALVGGACHYAIVGVDGRPPRPGDRAAGFRLSRTAVDEEELLLLAVDPGCRERGLGTAMVEALAQAARERGAGRLLLEVRAGNRAEELYRRCGFLQIGRRPNYYRAADGRRIDALTFARAIG